MNRPNTTLTSLPQQQETIFDIKDSVKELFTYVSVGIVGSGICIAGILGNIINLYVFLQLGFKDTINISFFGLTLSDLGFLITQLWLMIQYIPSFRYMHLPFDPSEASFRNVTGAWPHTYFSRVSGLITAYATFARCLSIALPLKVKRILTPRRTVIVTVFLFLVVLGMVMPVFVGNPMGWRYSPSKNRSIWGTLAMGTNKEADAISYMMCNICGYFSFGSTIVCTAVLVTALKSKAKWRQSATGGATFAAQGTSNVSSRDERIIKLMVIISTIFIVCFLPNTVAYMAAAVNSDFSIGGRYKNLFFMVVSLTLDLEAINSSVNVFIYFNMNTKYRNIVMDAVRSKPCFKNFFKDAAGVKG